MNYKNLYYAIVTNAINRPSTIGYFEKHHIIPKSLGGSDDSNNIVKLSAREHFICHYLLAKMYPYESSEWFKMNHALMIMKSSSNRHDRYVNSRLYEALRTNFSKVMKKAQSGENNAQYGSRWVYSDEAKQSKRIAKHEALPDGWNEGRKLNWRKITIHCKKCNNLFEQQTKELYCSDSCRIENRHTYSPTSNWKPILEEIAKSFQITFGSVTSNKEFVTRALTENIPKNQILWFLRCNNSGANYKTLNEL